MQEIGTTVGGFRLEPRWRTPLGTSIPGLPDVSGRSTNTFQAKLTRGGTIIFHETLNEGFGDVRIVFGFHLTEVDGAPVVQKVLDRVTGCP